MRGVLLGVSVYALLMLQATAFAGEAGSEAEWWLPSAGPVTAWIAIMMDKGKWAVQPIVSYSHTRGTFDDDGKYHSFPEGDKKATIQQQLFVQYGITNRWEVDVLTVYQESRVTESGAKAHHQGLGDSYLYTRYEFVKNKGLMPEVTGLLQLKVPTGQYQHEDPDKLGTDVPGTGSWDPGVGIVLTKKIKPFMFHADAIALFPQHVQINGVKTQYATAYNYDLAVEYFLPKGFNLMMELNGAFQGNRKDDDVKVTDSDSRSLIFSPGIGWANERVQTLVAYQRTLTGLNVDANDAVVATVIWIF